MRKLSAGPSGATSCHSPVTPGERHMLTGDDAQHHLVTSAGPWPSFDPGALEAVGVGLEHIAARGLLEMHHGPV